MNNIEANNALNELNNLLQLLAPEFNEFKGLVSDMGKIDSPYKNDFNHIEVLMSREGQITNGSDIHKIITVIMSEFNQFSSILNNISNDEDARQLYADEGLLDKCEHFKNNIEAKLGLQSN